LCLEVSPQLPKSPTPILSLDDALVSTHAAGDHTLFIGEVVEAYVRSTDRPLTSQELPYVYLGGQVLFDQTSRRPLESR
jgi:flavin reductase (DIM6/NTAB) family NADH-FMN oxidoreductase RutF